MRGHQHLVTMRRAGRIPRDVWVDTVAQTCDPYRDWPRWSESAHVLVEPDDSVGRLDLRCLVGLTTWVTGQDQERVRAVADACVKAGAGRVMTAVVDCSGVYPETVSMTDTEGVCVWPQ